MHVNDLFGSNKKVQEGLPGSLSSSDYTAGATKKHTDTNCTTCHGRKVMYKTPDGKMHADNKTGAKKITCPACKGSGNKVNEGSIVEDEAGIRAPRNNRPINRGRFTNIVPNAYYIIDDHTNTVEAGPYASVTDVRHDMAPGSPVSVMSGSAIISRSSRKPAKPVMKKVVEAFGSRAAEQWAQKLYDDNPNLGNDELVKFGYELVKSEVGTKTAKYLFAYDEDFADDFIGAYQYLQQGGAAHVREGWKEKAAAAALAGTMATGANSIVVNPARIIGPQGQTVADPYKSGASKKSTPVDDEWAKIEKRKAADKKVNESDGASVEDIEGAIYRRINALHPTLNKKFSQNEIDEAVYNVACFHEGATELGSSDISIMVRQVLRSLENAQGEETFEGVANDALKSMGLDFGPGNEEEDQKSFQQAFGRKAPHSPRSEGYRAGLTNYKDLPNQHNPYTRGTAEHEEFDAGFEEGVRDSHDHWSESVEEGTGLSYQTLSSYKKKAGAQASAADKAGDYKKGHKRFKGIVRATEKEFDKDARKDVKEEHSAECDTDQLLSYLTSAWRRVVNMHENDHFTTDGFQKIRLVYELLRDPLLKGDFSGFERAWEYVSGKFVDAFDFFAEIAFEEAGLAPDQGTYEQFIDKCRSGSIDEGDHPVPKLDPRVAQKLAQKVADKKWAAHQADDKKKQQEPIKSGERTLEDIHNSLTQRYIARK